jgi:hypothetical protein
MTDDHASKPWLWVIPALGTKLGLFRQRGPEEPGFTRLGPKLLVANPRAKDNLEQYQHYAAQCVEIAQSLSDEKYKLALLDMAFTWVRLAEAAEKEGAADRAAGPRSRWSRLFSGRLH